MPKPRSAFPVPCAGVLLLALSLGACSNMQPSLGTPLQEATWEAGRVCNSRYPTVNIDRVEPDGRYSYKAQYAGSFIKEFQECVGTERAKIMYATAPQKDLVRKAYLTKVAPASGDRLISGPPPSTQFTIDQPVIFYLELNKSGRATAAKFKWYDPAGTIAHQNDRTLRDGTGGTGGWSWFIERLPSANLRQPGQWDLEVTFDEQIIGRYPFTVSPQ